MSPKDMVKPKTKMPPRWALISLGIILFLIAGGSGIYLVSCHSATPSTTTPSDTTTPPPDTTLLQDTTPPLISKITVAGYTGETATITWETDEDATGQVEYGTTDAYGKLAASDGKLTTGHSIELTGLQPNTTYHFRVKSADGSGNDIGSGDHDFTTWVAEKDWAKYVNEEYGFSIRYPAVWEQETYSIYNYLPTSNLVAYFRVPLFVPYMYISALDADAPVTADWIKDALVESIEAYPRSISDLQEETLADGTIAFTCEATYRTVSYYEARAYVLVAEKEGKRILVDILTLPHFIDYDAALYSQIAHTLRFTPVD